MPKEDYIFDSERGRQAGLRSGELRREEAKRRKTMKEDLKFLLELALDEGRLVEHDEILNLAQGAKKNISVQTAIDIAMVQRALLGDVQAAQYIRDTIGEKPSDKLEVDQSLTIEAWAKKNRVKL